MFIKKLPLAGLSNLLGRSGFFWLGICLLTSFSLGLIDYGFARLLQILLYSLGLVPQESIPLQRNLQFSLELLLFLFLGLGILRAISQFWAYQSSDYVYETINTRLRLFAIYEVLLGSSQKYVSATETNSRIGEIFPQTAWFFWYSSWTLSFGVECLVLLAAMLSLAWRESVLAVFGLVTIGLLVLKVNQRVRVMARQVPEEQKALVGGIERIARNWLLVRILRLNTSEYQHLVGKNLSYYQKFIKAKFWGNIGAVLPLVLGVVLLILILFMSLEIWKTPGIQLVSCLYLFSRFLSTFSRLGRGFGIMNSVAPHLKLSLAYLSDFKPIEIQQAMEPMKALKSFKSSDTILPDTYNSAEAARDHSQQLKSPPNIELTGVSFSYFPDSPRIFNNISLQIKSGEQFGLIGKSGSGKSTLLGLILGVIQPSNGTIKIANIDAPVFFANPDLRVGYVGAEPFLIEGSIKDNLDYGTRKPYSLEEYREALAAASLLEVVDSLPDGLNYQLTENSQGLSAGQKQRLALARALLSKPQILVLDEVSANLDDETETEIAKELLALKGRCTVIIVSHRQGILKFADTIVELSSNGSLSQLN
ncbi:ABC transporter ATP-binding protein [Crocosphaera sp. UHCC 0190]|uniref:ABC transporter ATP-binding protein n=1 Tax=Crocosphaera sp. UHCC 0190 TaxID=3110246 RepID=UPI002B205C80|nr:ABC transporter ATP-binding protein [Crocosphaera sp. UHCC 0190]MEA5510547.1 ABC transporter ATP-binding protein [Crocosphaera sp. UHCC 0190]